MAYKRRVNTRRHPKRRLRKRWHVGLNVGRGVPIIGGTTFSAGSGNFVKRMVRSELLRHQDVKQWADTQLMQSGSSLNHDTIYVASPIMGLTQGVGSSQRIGNEIFLRYIKIHGLLGTTLPEARYRVMCVASTRVYNPATTTPAFWGGVAGSFLSDNFFVPANNTPLFQRLVNKQNTDFVVLHDKKYTIRPDIANAPKTVPFDDTCKVMKKVEFTSTSVGPLRTWNYYVLIIPYSPTKVVGDPVGFVESQFLLTYTDS